MRPIIKYMLPGLIFIFKVLPVNAQTPLWSWVNYAASSDDERVTDVASDPITGGVFAVGWWEKDISGDLPGLATPYGNEDGFVAKYNRDGTVAWAFSIGSTGDDQCYAVSTDDSGFVYVTGYFRGTAQFRGVPTSSAATLTSSGAEDAFIARYDNNGNLDWLRQGSSNNEVIGRAIHADADGVYVTGGTRGPVSFGGANLPYLNGMDAWTVRLNKYNGVPVWSRYGLGNGDNERGLGIISDATDVYVVGMFASLFCTFDGSTTLINPTAGFRDIYVIRRDKTTGSLQWAQRIGAPDGEEAHGIALDATGVFVTGGCDDDNGTVSFPNSVNVSTGNSGEDIFVCRLWKNNGFTNWVNIEQNNVGDDCRGDDVVFDGNGNIYVTGTMHGTTMFNSGAANIVASSDDIFVSAYHAATGNFLWAKRAGSSANDEGYGLDTSWGNSLYLGGYYGNAATFDTVPQLPNNGAGNIWVGRIGGSDLVANVDSVCVPFQATANVDVQDNDDNPANSPLTTTIVTPPIQGTLSLLSNDSIRYSANPGFIGLDSLRYQVCDTTGFCDQAWVFFKVFPVANAGPDVQLCGNDATLMGNDPTPGSGTWRIISGSGTLAAPSNFNTNITGMIPGNTTLEWEIVYLGCSSIDSVNLEVDTVLPNITCPNNQIISNDSGLCTARNSFPLLFLNDNCGIPSLNYYLSQATSGSGIGNASTTPFNLGSTLVTYKATDTAGNIDSCSFTVTVNDTSPPSIFCPLDSTISPTASCNYVLNDLTSLAIVNNNCPGSIGVSQSPMNGTPLNSNTPVTFTATDANGNTANCTFNILLDLELANVDAGPDTTFCGSSLPLNGSNPMPGTGTWTVFQGAGTFNNANDNFATVSGLNPGLNQLVWSVSEGNCTGSDTVRINNANASFANAGSDSTICGSNYQLNAVLPGGGVGQWTVLSGGGNLANDSLPDTQISGLNSGPNQLQWQVTLGTCMDSTTVTITSFDSVFADAGMNDTVCGSSGTLTAISPSMGSGMWSVVSGSGNIASPNSAATQVTGLGTFLNQFQWTVVNGVCADSAIIHLFSTGAVTAEAGVDLEVCGPNVTLNATPPTAGAGRWSVIAGGGNISNDTLPNTDVIGLNPGVNTFRWTLTNGNCVDFDQVEVLSWAIPDPANAGPDQLISLTNPVTLAGNDPQVGKGMWTQLSGSSTLSFLVDTLYNTQVTGFVGGGSYELDWSIKHGSCPHTSDQVLLEVSSLVIPEVITANGDGKNDTWHIQGLENYENVKVTIVNRWGNKVFSSDNYQNDWAGTNKTDKALTDDTYYYVIEMPDGESYGGFLVVKR